ncbi:MAG: choice-of-anchor D domain-containing protein, partial [Pseudomonadota bacterium]
MKNLSILLLRLCALAMLVAGASNTYAYETYSVARTSGNCANCHGDFRASPYVSPRDGVSWGDDLHDVHRNAMLGGDCNACHSASGRFPVILNSSVGGTGLDPLACVGCHGRAEPEASGQVRGSGLRQHHYNSGVTLCVDCHGDANPTAFNTVAENIAPPYYFTPDAAHPNKPTDPCNPSGQENFAGSALGLDNDGDALYDQTDPDCQVAVPNIVVDPATLAFGDVTLGMSATLATTISNAGTADLTVTNIVLGAGTSSEYSIGALTLPLTIAPGASQDVQVTYMPMDIGGDSGSLVIQSDDPDQSTVSVVLSGAGIAVPVPDINLNPAAIDFSVVAIGASSSLMTQIENLGNAALSVTLIDRCLGTSAEFNWMPLASMTIAPGASETLTVNYMPVDVGTDTGCLAISSNDPDEALVELGVAGSGTELAVPDINLLPPALDFGVVTIGGDATLSAQIQNTGSAALTIVSIALAAGTSAEFTLVMPPATPLVIQPGGSETVSVRYAPVDAGMDSGAVEIASDDPDEATVQLALSGSGAVEALPDINLNPDALNFGTVTIGSIEPRTTMIENLGNAALTVSLIDRCMGTSSEFTWAPSGPFTIAAGAAQALAVSYTPVDVGTDMGCLAIASDDPDESSVELGVEGTGQMVRPIKQVNIQAPGAINPDNNGV